MICFNVLCMPLTSYAATNHNDCINDIIVYSPENPEAYFEIEKVCDNMRAITDEESYNITVYVEDKYDYINGVLTCISSELLSEEEVNEIGKENFESNIDSIMPRGSTTTHGKCTINIVKQNLGNISAPSYRLVANATWSGAASLLNAENTPAVDYDFVGFSWGGNHDYRNGSITVVDSVAGNRSYSQTFTSPNKSIAWKFYEGRSSQDDFDYAKQINCSIDIFKNVATGGGNTTSAVFNYIHTYEALKAGWSISLSENDALGIELNSESKQWTIACDVTGLYY